jgi:tetratricopeptide (TPR) repeat protein
MNRSLSRRERAQITFEAGDVHLGAQAYDEARKAFEEAVSLNPLHSKAHLGLSMATRNLGMWPEAERSARASLEADPHFARAAHYLGALLVEQDRLSEALPFLQAAVSWEPNVAQHQRDLGVTQLFLGDIEGARARLLRTIELDVHTHEVLYTLIRMWKMDDGSEGAAQLLEIVKELEAKAADLPDAERAQVLFALGKAHEDRGEYKEAATTFARANAVKRATLDYDVSTAETRMQRLAGIFDAKHISQLVGKGAQSHRPIFIVGMPRSGSTLVEQILCAHPEVHGGGEMYTLPSLIDGSHGPNGSPYPEWATTMNDVDCATIGKAYLDRIPAGLPGRSRTTDKWLENFEHLGLIAVCLPNAKVIHCHRDPRDQLLSCWSLLFSQNQEYAYDLDEMRRYYRAYRGLMEHWRSVLPSGFMLEVRYESLVADPESQSRRILSHCDLEWEEDVLRYWEARRPVKSASMFQVRQPIYDSSIGRWKPFSKHIGKLFTGLGGD